jgi:hypothetical protein
VNKKNLLILLILATCFKEIIWSATTPLWHTPDEQAHFAQVQNTVEVRGDPKGQDLSNEIATSEQLLGTFRDEQGKNSFTHHPEYNIAYTDTSTGKFEEKINSIPFYERTKFIKNEATNYPPLFYLLSSIPYRIFYTSGLITRAFTVRFSSIIFGIFTVYFTYLISRLIFPKKFLFQITSAVLVSFQPMFTFVSAGTNSDNLFNALFTIFIYLYLKLIQQFNVKYVILIFFTLWAGISTKVQMYVLFFPLFLLLVYLFLKSLSSKKTHKKTKTVFFIISFSLVLFLLSIRYVLKKTAGGGDLIPEISLSPNQKAIDLTLFDHFIWTLRHTIAEVVPWYWGVFKWLGVTLPRIVNRVINRFTIIAAFGILIKIITIFKKKEFNFQNAALGLLMFFSLYYFFILMIWDYFFRVGHGFSLGFQGRYYFPTISAHMILLQVGLLSLLPKKFIKIKYLVAKSLVFLMIILNFIGLFTLANSYYDLSSFQAFLIQISQYKPFFYKGFSFVFLGIIYLLLISTLLVTIAKYPQKKTDKND